MFMMERRQMMMKKSWLIKLFGAFMAIMLITGCNTDDTDNQDRDTNNQGEMQPDEDTNQGVDDDDNNVMDNDNNKEDVIEDNEDVNDADNKDE
jgi:hypothetical protein